MIQRMAFCALALAWPGALFPADYDYGLVGLSSLETARLAAVCSEDGPRGAVPCEIEFVILDRAGRPVKRSAATLQPGVSAFMDYRLPDSVAAGRRGELIPCIRVLAGAVWSNLQVMDNFTNRTRLSRNLTGLPAPAGGEIHYGSAGLTGLDTARLGAVCAKDPSRADGGDPCQVTFIVHDLQGRILKQSPVTLMPGAGGSMDFRTAEAGLPARRGEIVPCVRVLRGSVLGTLDVFDSLSGLSLTSAGAAAALLP